MINSIKNKLFLLTAATLPLSLVLSSSTTNGDIVQFGLTSNGSGTINGNVLTVEATGLQSNGVIFDAVLTVSGGGMFVDNDPGGVGVDNPFIESEESLSFDFNAVNAVGGNVTFDGFTELNFNFFAQADGDEATFSTGDIIGDQDISNFDLTTLNGGAPNQFTITGTGGLEQTQFQLSGITAEFSASPTSVPEPRAFSVVFAVLMVCCANRRVRNKRLEFN